MAEHVTSDTIEAPVALVTGSSRGLGRGIALELAGSGWSVAVHYVRSREEADETVAMCEARRCHEVQRFHVFQADLASPASRAEMVSRVFDTFGTIDALVNNAGIAPPVRADITEASLESFRQVMATNLEGPHFLTQNVVARWRASAAQGGTSSLSLASKKIVFITSISAETASVNRAEYCMSKAALSMSARLWATRLAPEGALVFEIRPGIMKTDMTRAVEQKYDWLIGEGLVPAGRWGLPEDVGRMVRAVLSGDFDFAAGSVLYCDGGFHLSRL
ncbi:MAG: 3-ketoacyl-ACP reductase [Rectinema sp.]|nr:3-ketoacyl-ACP reductase [Rectinema sp.]